MIEYWKFSGLFLDSPSKIFKNVFRQSEQNFRDCFQTVWTEFSGLFSGSLDRIFGTIFGQFGTDFRTLCVFLYVLSKN